MPLTQDQEDLEHEWKVKAMKADVALKTEQTHWEPWQVVLAAATVFVSLGGALGGLIGFFLGQAQHH